MSDEDVPTDLDVRLEWPEVETPAVTKRRLRETPTSDRKPRSGRQALVPQRRARGSPADELFGQMDALTRMLEKQQRGASVDDLAKRVDRLASTLRKERTGAHVKRAGDEIKGLVKRVDSLARTVEALPAGSTVADLVGRVDTLASTIEVLCQQIGSNAERLDAFRDQLTASLEPLYDATAEVRRLNETVTDSVVSRSDRHAELRTEIETLVGEVRELRHRVPVQKSADGNHVAQAVSEAVKAALGPEEPAHRASAPKRPGRTAAKKSTGSTAKKPAAAAKKSGRATAKKSGRATAKKSGRATAKKSGRTTAKKT